MLRKLTLRQKNSFLIKKQVGNFKKIPQLLGMDSEYPTGYKKKQILTVVQENCESCEVFHRKTYLLNFVSLFTKFSPRLSAEVHFHF